MSTLSHAKITPRPSSARGHHNYGWLNTYHTFAFASYFDDPYQSFGALIVLNEDRVAPQTGFPTHPHRNAEIFSYVLSGELTHRDSMHGKAAAKGLKEVSKDDYYVMKRGDIQFTTGGTGIAHAEQNEHSSLPVHFLQIWATPWKTGLVPRYHTMTFSEESKRAGFITVLSPLKAGIGASAEEEKAAEPVVEGTIPVHADLVMGASIIGAGKSASWRVGGEGEGVVKSQRDRKVFVHLPMRGLKAKIRLAGQEGKVLGEGDGAFVEKVNVGDELVVESVGEGEAEVVVLDSN